MASIIKANQIQDFGGNSIIGSDGTGNLTTQKILYPAFDVKLSADQNISDNVFTVVAYDTVILDTDNGFSTSTYRYTCQSGKSGKYFIGGLVLYNSGADSTLNYADLYIYKNTVIHSYQITQFNANPGRQYSHQFGVLMDLSDGDYVEVQGRSDRTSSGTLMFRGDAERKETRFFGYRIGS